MEKGPTRWSEKQGEINNFKVRVMITSTLFGISRVYSAAITAGSQLLAVGEWRNPTEENTIEQENQKQKGSRNPRLEEQWEFGSQIRLVPGSGEKVAQTHPYDPSPYLDGRGNGATDGETLNMTPQKGKK